jgi:hypothetical protein
MNLSGPLKLAVSGLLFTLISATNQRNFDPKSDVYFLLRIRDRPFNNEDSFTLKTTGRIGNSAFNSNKPTTFVIHGYLEDRIAEHQMVLCK